MQTSFLLNLIPNDQQYASEVSKLDCVCRICEYGPSHLAAKQSEAASNGPKALYEPNRTGCLVLF